MTLRGRALLWREVAGPCVAWPGLALEHLSQTRWESGPDQLGSKWGQVLTSHEASSESRTANSGIAVRGIGKAL